MKKSKGPKYTVNRETDPKSARKESCLPAATIVTMDPCCPYVGGHGIGVTIMLTEDKALRAASSPLDVSVCLKRRELKGEVDFPRSQLIFH